MGNMGQQPRKKADENRFLRRRRPTTAQREYLERGLLQPGGKLPLFDEFGQSVPSRTIRACIAAGWAEPWFNNPLKPDWLVCRLTSAGYQIMGCPTPMVQNKPN